MIGAWTSDGVLIGEARTRAELLRAHPEADEAAYVGPRDWLPDEIAAAAARGSVEAIAALSVSALTLAIEPLTVEQLEALLLIEGRRVGGGRSTAMREISLAIDARVGR